MNMTLEDLSGITDARSNPQHYTMDEIYQSICEYIQEYGCFTVEGYNSCDDYGPNYLTIVNNIKEETDIDDVEVHDVLYITGAVNEFHTYKPPDFNAWYPHRYSQHIAQLIWDITKDNITVEIKNGRLIKDIEQMEFYDLKIEITKRLDDELKIQNLSWFIRIAGVAGWIDIRGVKLSVDPKRYQKKKELENMKNPAERFGEFGGDTTPKDSNKPEKFSNYF